MFIAQLNSAFEKVFTYNYNFVMTLFIPLTAFHKNGIGPKVRLIFFS